MLLNRRHIRIKVMQTLYAFKSGESDNLVPDTKFLFASANKMYDLYLLLISIFVELHVKAEAHIEKSQKKHLATAADINPNRKFVLNRLLVALVNNSLLKEELEHRKITNWQLDDEYIDILFKELISSDLYKDYMNTKRSDFKADKYFLVDIYKDIIAPNDKLYDYLEDKNLTWIDDLPVINTNIVKLLKKAQGDSVERHFLPQLFKNEDDRDFADQLLKKTILNRSKLTTQIKEKTKNWDAERIAQIDYALMQMAICELNYFPSIPVKVTINEYLEIAKEYSTPKSSIFINGILDKLIKEYKEADNLNKMGRGLM